MKNGLDGQSSQCFFYRADGAIATGGVAQLVLGRSQSRTSLMIQNISDGPLFLEIGSGAATATISGGAISGVTVTNAGFNYTLKPLVRFLGGGSVVGNTLYTGLAQPGAPSPNSVGAANLAQLGRPAVGHCVMTGSPGNLSIASIVVDDPGAGYVIAPYVQIINSDLDPNGAALPANNVGILLTAGSAPYKTESSICPTDPVAIWGPTIGQAFICRWTD